MNPPTVARYRAGEQRRGDDAGKIDLLFPQAADRAGAEPASTTNDSAVRHRSQMVKRRSRGSRLILVRHGETEGESSIRYHGRTDVALSELGRAQMRLAGAGDLGASRGRREFRAHLFESARSCLRRRANRSRRLGTTDHDR